MLVPGRVDGAPGVLAHTIIRLVHHSRRFRDTHGAELVAHGDIARDRPGELVVKPAPGVDAVLAEARDEILLRQRQQFVATLAGVFHGEPRGCDGVIVEVGLDHLFGGEVEELAERLGDFREPLVDGLQTAKERLRALVLAVHAQAALGVGLRVVDEPPGLFDQCKDLARLSDRVAGRTCLQPRDALKQRRQRRIATLDLG